MATPATTFLYGHDLFSNFQLGLSRPTCTDEPTQAPPTYYTAPLEQHYYQELDVAKPSPPINELAATSLTTKPSCAHCKGRRDYTAYFHNSKIFAEPPHELLKLVEAYVQKNRLESLLINYVLRAIEQDDIEQIQKNLEVWETQVHNLAATIGDGEALSNLRSWTSRTKRQLWEHVVGIQKMEMWPGKSKELVSEFRKLWEAVWVECVSMKNIAPRDDTASN
ncbi:uncharacterized protein PAC_01482 [Phialocephala subalpina]|uniref:Uncharacterized protein n=1 Tax=Phialocephala subalpina TaxID=576137 RepID=A0A1L7WFQ8_9HELO|nr:uncharacterized protein PAC_01482 [Phialocephala subalpina]